MAAGRFSLKDVVLSVICVVFTIEAVAPASAMGNVQFFWWGVLIVTFLLPYGMVVAELGSTYTSDGGLYDWVRAGLGDKWGSRCAWYYWVNFPLWIASVACIYPSVLLSVWGVELPLWGRILLELAFVWGVTLGAFSPVSDADWIMNGGAIIKVLITLGVAGVGLWFAGAHGFANPMTPDTFLPNLADPNSLTYLSVILFNFMGFEVVATFTDSMANPRRDIPHRHRGWRHHHRRSLHPLRHRHWRRRPHRVFEPRLRHRGRGGSHGGGGLAAGEPGGRRVLGDPFRQHGELVFWHQLCGLQGRRGRQHASSLRPAVAHQLHAQRQRPHDRHRGKPGIAAASASGRRLRGLLDILLHERGLSAPELSAHVSRIRPPARHRLSRARLLRPLQGQVVGRDAGVACGRDRAGCRGHHGTPQRHSRRAGQTAPFGGRAHPAGRWRGSTPPEPQAPIGVQNSSNRRSHRLCSRRLRLWSHGPLPVTFAANSCNQNALALLLAEKTSPSLPGMEGFLGRACIACAYL
ncbi:APC family permease [Muricaecibacterium torontonense]|uniref:APC family permease n=1 Tax=Muricaecibacterium torontonense TaxID=3032871 RepID=A0A4S2F3T3_9ACTN|nr:APC family permease [Muricaecibacterium torontonense]